MALLQFSGIGITAASGKIGNKVIQRTRGGITSREWVIPTNTITDSREDIWNLMTALSQLWATLSDEERIAWGDDASNYPRKNRLNQIFIPSGFSHFIASGFGLTINGLFPLMFPAPIHRPINPGSITFGTVSPTQVNVTFALANGATILPANVSALISASACVSAGVMYKRSDIPVIANAFPSDTISGDLFGPYSARFGAPITGEKIFFKIRTYSGITGMPSPFLQASVIVS